MLPILAATLVALGLPNAGGAAVPAVVPKGIATPAPGPGDYEASGVAAPARTTLLSPKATGVIKAIKVREGAFVKAGQVLCQLDSADAAIRVAGAEVALAQAEEALKNARDDLARAEELFKGNAVAQQGIEKARLGARMAELAHDSARVGLRAAKQALADTSLRAPFAGVVTKVLAEEGQLATMMPPTMVFELADTTALEVRAAIPERMIAKVKPGTPVVVALPALGAEVPAAVKSLPPVVDSRTRAAEAVIRIDNRERGLPAGLFARVRFPGIKAEGSASVNAAVGASAEGGR